ncbi:MAG: hypothetical protein KF819_12230 [Labilithrix sp.]|nr:hypothetical protein [Labilithrix sp.]
MGAAKRGRGRIACGIVLVVAASACGTAEPEPAPSPADAGQAPASEAAQCILPLPIDTPTSSSCPAGCVEVIATQLDGANACVRAVLLGCISCPQGCGGAPEGPCYKNVDDGRVVRAPTYAVDGRPDWVACTAAEEAQIGTAPRCSN